VGVAPQLGQCVGVSGSAPLQQRRRFVAFESLAQLVTDTGQGLRTAVHAKLRNFHAELEALRADVDRGFERVEAAIRRDSSSIV